MEDGVVSGIEEKPVINRYVNAGIYCMNKDLLGLIPENTYFDMPQLLEASMAKSHKVRAFPIHEYWLDVGHPETLRQANGDWN